MPEQLFQQNTIFEAILTDLHFGRVVKTARKH